MASLADGSYLIRCFANPSLAIDCEGATDTRGTNIRLFEANYTDAQIVRVWTRADGSRQLCFAATGLAFDVADGDLYTQGKNVRQWDANDTDAQRFTVKAVDGKKYGDLAVWKIYATATIGSSQTERLVEVDGTGTPTSGQNICLSKDEASSTDQMWVFVPQNPVPSGTYMIRSALDSSLVIDIEGSSHAAGARAFIAGAHAGTGPDGGNNQLFYVRDYNSSGQTKLWAIHSWQVLEIAYRVSEAYQGDQVVQSWDEQGTTDQLWTIVPDGSAELNGVNVPAYELRNVAAQGATLCLDVTGGQSAPGTYLRLWERNGAKAQRWIFDPMESYEERLPVPAPLGLVADGSSAAPSKRISGIISNLWRAEWSGSDYADAKYQVRYRYATRAPGGRMGSFSDWLAGDMWSRGNSGWGTVQTETFGVERLSDGTKAGPRMSIPPADGKSVDRVSVQAEIRTFALDNPGPGGDTDVKMPVHGPSATMECTIAYKPKVTVTAAGWSPDGLIVSYESDWQAPGIALTIWSADATDAYGRVQHILSHSWSTRDVAGSGTVTVPISQLSGIPQDGSELVVSMTLADDAVASKAMDMVTLAWDASHGITVVPAYMHTDRETLMVTIARHETDEVWMLTGEGLERCEEVSSTSTRRTYEAVPPIGEPYSICMVSRQGTSWGTNIDQMPAIAAGEFVWTWTEGKERRAAILYAGREDAPKGSDSVTLDYERHITTGRDYPVYTFGESRTRDLTATGAIVLDDGSAWSTREAIDALVAAHHALYRDPLGGRHHVAILGREIPMDSGEALKATITQEEESA